MSDTPVGPNPTPDPKPRRTRGDVNREHLEELGKAQQVAASAVNPDYTEALAEVELDATLPNLIQVRAADVQAKLAKLKEARTGKGEMTDQEKNARGALLVVIQPIQTAAKRKFTGDTAKLRDAYYINQPLAAWGLKEVVTAGKNILSRLVPGEDNAPPLDVLPGIKADGAIQALTDALALYETKDKEQGKKQSESAGTLEEIEQSIDVLASLRRQIQLAADQAFPWRKEGVNTIRKAFLLPVDRPFGE